MKLDKVDIIILRHKANGRTMKEIAPMVFLSLDGVRDRLRRLRKEFDCRDTTQLIHRVFHEKHTKVLAEK